MIIGSVLLQVLFEIIGQTWFTIHAQVWVLAKGWSKAIQPLAWIGPILVDANSAINVRCILLLTMFDSYLRSVIF